MKNVVNLMFGIVLLTGIVGCDKTGNDYVDPVYKLKNESSHFITVVYQTDAGVMDTLAVLPNLEAQIVDVSYLCNPAATQLNKIYYDNRYVIEFSELLYCGPNYTYRYQLANGGEYYLYTFTEEDYLYAVEHGKNLQEKR